MPSFRLHIRPMLETEPLSTSSTPRTPSPRASTRRGTAAKAEASSAEIEIEATEAVKPKRVRKPKAIAEDGATQEAKPQANKPEAKPRATRKTKAAEPVAEVAAAPVKPARVKGRVYSAEEMVEAVVTVIDDAKGEDIVALDLFGKTTIADAMVVASGRSERHVGAIAERIASTLKDMGQPTPKIEGMTACDWVLIDTGDIIIHLFRPEVRGFYNLEKLWGAGRPSEGAAPEPKLAGPAKPSKPIKIKAEGATTPRKPRRKAESA